VACADDVAAAVVGRFEEHFATVAGGALVEVVVNVEPAQNTHIDSFGGVVEQAAEFEQLVSALAWLFGFVASYPDWEDQRPESDALVEPAELIAWVWVFRRCFGCFAAYAYVAHDEVVAERSVVAAELVGVELLVAGA
jgi:hypothetical protein